MTADLHVGHVSNAQRGAVARYGDLLAGMRGTPEPLLSGTKGPRFIHESRPLVPKGGFEPPRAFAHYALNVARLPVPPFRRAPIIYRAAQISGKPGQASF